MSGKVKNHRGKSSWDRVNQGKVAGDEVKEGGGYTPCRRNMMAAWIWVVVMVNGEEEVEFWVILKVYVMMD